MDGEVTVEHLQSDANNGNGHRGQKPEMPSEHNSYIGLEKADSDNNRYVNVKYILQLCCKTNRNQVNARNPISVVTVIFTVNTCWSGIG